MTYMQFFGCALISLSMPFWLFILTITNDPLKIITLLTSAFFWLIALLFSGILWSIVPLKEELAFGVVFSVIFQEMFRTLFAYLARMAKRRLIDMSGSDRVTHGSNLITSSNHLLAYVAGLGFGMMSGIFSIVNILSDLAGPATIGIKGDSQEFFLVSAFLSAMLVVLHVFWSVILFNAVDNPGRARKLFGFSIVIVTHMLVSCVTLLNQQHFYAASLTSTALCMAITGVFAFHTVGGTMPNLCAALAPNRNGHMAVN